MHNKLVWIFLMALTMATKAFAGNPQSFIYKGRLSELNSQSISGNVSFRFQILNPGKDCLLYEEIQTLDMTGKDGRFNVAVGSAVTSGLRSANDPGLEMAKIFSNPAQVLRTPGTNCSTGYTPSAGDTRYLRVSVTQGSTTDVLSPDQVIATVPFATTAETLQGKLPGHFLQINSSGSSSLNQASLEQVFENSAFTRLMGLLNNSSPKDMSNQRITSVAAPTSGTDAANKDYTDSRIAGISVNSSAFSSMQSGSFLSYNGSQWSPMTLPPHVMSNPPACTVGQASRWDGSVWSCVNAGGSGGAGGAGTLTANNNEVVLSAASEKVQMVNFTTAGAIRLPAATSFTNTGGPIYQLLNAQSLDVPILNADGKLVGHVPANAATDIFLFNNTSTGGQWLSSAPATTNALIEKVILQSLSAGMTPSSYGYVYAVTDNLGLYLYGFDNGGNWEVRAATVTVNPSTKSFVVGSFVTLASSAPSPSLGLHVLSPSKVVVEMTSNGQKNLQLVGISGSTLTPMGAMVNLSTYCSYGTIFKTYDGLFCYEGGNIHKYSALSSLTYVGSSSATNQPGWILKLGSQDIVAFCDGAQMLNVVALNVPGTVGTNQISGSSNCSGYPPTDPIKNYLEIDSTSAWLLLQGNPQRKVKVSWNGSLNVVSPPSSIGVEMGYSAGLLTTGAQAYLTAGSGSAKKARVTDPSTLSLGPLERANDCYGVRSDISHCTNFSVDGSNLKGQFQIGY